LTIEVSGRSLLDGDQKMLVDHKLRMLLFSTPLKRSRSCGTFELTHVTAIYMFTSTG
jgi:hypothetical protein